MDELLTIAKIKDLSAAERQVEITRCEILLMDLRIKKVTKQNIKSHEFKKLRTYIAQLISENNNENTTE